MLGSAQALPQPGPPDSVSSCLQVCAPAWMGLPWVQPEHGTPSPAAPGRGLGVGQICPSPGAEGLVKGWGAPAAASPRAHLGCML